MNIKLLAPLVLLLLAACEGNPIGTGEPPPPPVPPCTVDCPPVPDNPISPKVPAITGQNLEATTFTPGAPTITIRLRSQDAAALDATYARNATFDVDGYAAYTYQETGSNRFVVALVREQGPLKGGIAVDGGQFVNYFGGGTYLRADVFTRPTGAAAVGADANYSGTYVGLWNAGPATPGGPGGDLNPTRSYRIDGRALITADFTDMSVSGGVDQRRILDAEALTDTGLDALDRTATNVLLPTIGLKATEITDIGSFVNKVVIGTQEVGDYSGIFGPNAQQVAALAIFQPVNIPQLKEHGLIVLPSCATGGGPACSP